MPSPPPSLPPVLTPLVRRYVWWKTPEEALMHPGHALAHIMNLATLEDMLLLEASVDPQQLRNALTQAEAGWFSDKSWHFWHYRLRLIPSCELPPPAPTRRYS